MSRVVHLRTSERNIVACFEILSAHSLDTKIPISTAINRVLTAFIEGAISHGRIPDNGPETVADLVHLYTGEESLNLSSDPLAFGSEETSVGQPEISETDRDAISEAVSQMESGGIPIEAPDELPDLLEVKTPWDEFERMDYEKLKEVFPLDRYIVLAVDDPLMQRAVEVVYKAFPRSRWGDQKVDETIKGLYAAFQRWQEDHEAEI